MRAYLILIEILHFSNVHSVAVLTFTLCPLLAGALHNSYEFLLLIIRSLTNAGFASTISFCSNNLIVLFLHLSRAWLVMVLTLHWKEDHGCKIKDYLQNENVTHWKRGSRCRQTLRKKYVSERKCICSKIKDYPLN